MKAGARSMAVNVALAKVRISLPIPSLEETGTFDTVSTVCVKFRCAKMECILQGVTGDNTDNTVLHKKVFLSER